MLFNSFSFAVFFPVVAIVYYLLPEKVRPYLLLVASCVFYMAFVPKYIFILFALITLDFFLAQLLVKFSGHQRKLFLAVSVCANLGMLFWFKYFNFFAANTALLIQFLHWNYSPTLLEFALPLGLSFHVFQSLSYVIEVYKGKFEPEKNYFIYALYVMFFPQLVAGPIERPAHLLPQFRKEHALDESKIILGLERMLWGFFKKLVIADNLAQIVNHIYGAGILDGPALILAFVAFSYQLYCDFSGYSDIAVGTALVLGYEVVENFNRPYAARTIQEFWQRWHISLSNWLRDYLYYPLALSGKRHSRFRLYASLFITFVLIGLWHGANWTFIAMGALYGFYLVAGSITENWRKSLSSITGLSNLPRTQHFLQVISTFTMVSIAWVFFRSSNIQQAFSIVSHLGSNLSELLNLHYIRFTLLGFPTLNATSKTTLMVVVIAIVAMEYVQYLQEKEKTYSPWAHWPFWVRFSWRYMTIFSIIFFGYLGAVSFIYFQF